jgi:predicted phosphodiesterase
MTALSFEWTKKHATQKTREYLKRLPIEHRFFAQGKKISLFHAAPHKNNLYWYEDRPERFFMEMAGKSDADILIYGHTHKPYRKDFGETVFINAGSVGKPKDGDPRACVALLEVTPDTVKAEFLRIESDIKKTAAAIVERGLPAYFAEKLRQGR